MFGSHNATMIDIRESIGNEKRITANLLNFFIRQIIRIAAL